MGKRSNFERVERDFYPTPMKAVEPLIPHLYPGSSFFEPCAGDGTLVDHLISLGFYCSDAIDIEPQAQFIRKEDALTTDGGSGNSDYIITNPPWNRKILHPMIDHFVNKLKKRTWLLFDASWAHTKQSIPYMPYCSKIVSIGRVKWFPGSKMAGKDDCAWYFFEPDDGIKRKTIFEGRK